MLAVLAAVAGSALVGLAPLSAAAQVQPDVRQVAVPYRTPADFMQGLIGHHHLPLAVRFESQAQRLSRSVEALCHVPQGAGGNRAGEGAPSTAAASAQSAGTEPSVADVPAARARWTGALQAWSELSSVALGPLVERRTVRQIDFQPVRPALVLNAVAQPPDSVQAMDAVGAPAKGLPALEWLLWTRSLRAGTPDCRYAVLVSQDIAAEAAAVRSGFAALAASETLQDAEQAAPAMAEAVNQWVGAVEALRWRELGKPLESAQGARPAYARPYSGQAPQAWAAQWAAIAAMATGGDVMAPAGASRVSLEAYLRGRGLNQLADQLVAEVRQTGVRVQALLPAAAGRKARGGPDAARVREAVRALGRLKALAEERLAPALQINIGFSDADGD